MAITQIKGSNIEDGTVLAADIKDGTVTNEKIVGMASSKLTGALPILDGAALTGVSSGEIYGFSINATGNLIVTTTNSGADNITSLTYDTFLDVIIAGTGYNWSLVGTQLRCTI